MAFVIAPAAAENPHITGWAVDGANIVVPINSFPELSAEEAAATTGDIRKVILALVDKFYAIYNGTATADKPVKMQVYRSTAVNDVAGTSTRTYTFTFTVDGSYEVAAEA